VFKRASLVVSTLLMAYFIFTSGLVFEAMKCQSTGTINVPYTLALSSERTGILSMYNADDVACAVWLAENVGELPFVADYNSMALLMGFRFWDVSPESSNAYYVFLTTWNTQHGKMVVGSGPGLRMYEPLPNLENAIEVFRRKDAVVYYVEPNTFKPSAMHTIGTSTAGDAWTQGWTAQRYSFFAAAKYWVFYGDGANMGFRSSMDGSTWNAFTAIRASSLGSNFSIQFDGVYVHYVFSTVWILGGDVYYRMGQPNSDGTITWFAAEQTVDAMDGTHYTTASEMYVVGADTSGWSQGWTAQRYTFFAATKYWCFYTEGYFGFRTSPDESDWSAFTEVCNVAHRGYDISIAFDGTYVHYVFAPTSVAGGDVMYRMGQPNSDGTITWLQVEQTVVDLPIPPPGVFSCDPTITVDSNGYPWIGYGRRDNNGPRAWVAKSSTKNGIWTNEAVLFTSPYQFSDSEFACTNAPGLWVSVTALSDGKVYAIAETDGFYTTFDNERDMKGRLWNGNSWEAEETVASSASANITGGSHSIVAEGNDLHMTYSHWAHDPLPYHLDSYYKKRTYGVGWGAPELIQAHTDGVSVSKQVVLSGDDSGTLYAFWMGDPVLQHVYYKKRIAGVWDVSSTDWITEPNVFRDGHLNVSNMAYNGNIIFTASAWNEAVSIQLVKFLDTKQ